MDELIYQVRKHGTVHVATRDQAIALIGAASAAGYTFGRRQTVAGVLVLDLDD
jgi:hypothetical protein